MNISFTKKQEKYITEQVKSGEYQNFSEVVREAIRLHIIYRGKIINDLRKEIEKGWQSPDSNLSIDEIITMNKNK